MEEITKKGVIVKFHKDNLTFDKENEDPVGTLTFNMLASFAQFERKLISMRCKAGIDKAKKNGVRLGREPSLSKEDIKALKLAIETGDKSKKEIADAFGISRATIYRIIKKENIKE